MQQQAVSSSTIESKELPAVQQAEEESPLKSSGSLRTTSFALIVIAVCMSLFLSALELSAVSTALPTIAHSLHNFPPSDFIWVGSCYSLAAAALLPMSGGLAQIFGRKPIILAAILLFAIGSAVCGSANGQAALLLGRTIQGMGGGGITALTFLIISDLVPLHQRGKYIGFLGLAWSFAGATGPVVGGVLAQKGAWRWIFYMNLPLCAVVSVLVICFLNLRTPRDTLREKIAKIDWIGNFIIIASTASSAIALTWAGATYPWSSPRVLVPLCLGFAGIASFVLYEAKIPREPTMPFFLVTNRTSLSGYLQTWLIQLILMTSVYYLPVYYQACKLASPIASGVDLFGLAMSSPLAAVLAGFTVATFQCYRPQLWIGWASLMIATGLMSTLTYTSPLWRCIGFSIFLGFGLGGTYTATLFPVLAPLPITANAPAIALAMFIRVFGQVWGVTLGGTILQNGLRGTLPVEVLNRVSDGGDLAYATIAIIRDLPPDVRAEVQNAFGHAMNIFWRVLIGVSGFGLLVSLFMADKPMHKYTDEKWDSTREVPKTELSASEA